MKNRLKEEFDKNNYEFNHKIKKEYKSSKDN